MSTEINIHDLMLRWQEAVARGEAPSADELCHDCPELVQVLESELSNREFGRVGVSDVVDTDPSPGRQVPEGLVANAEPVPGYRLVGRIGEGSTGEVWKAIGPGGFPVAIKFVRVSDDFDPSPTVHRRRFNNLRSLELMREVRHPNLLPLFAAWVRDGLLVFVMELADRTLQDRLHEAMEGGLTGIPPAELFEYMRQAAEGIDHLNDPRHTLVGRPGMGIQHRDIKPQNLLLVGGCVKVGDFGQAKLLDDAVHNTGSLTAAYAPPELFQGLMSRRSDQYSLAVTYCELRGGRLPFVGNPLQIMMGHFQGIPDLSMIPAVERPAVERALAKRPAERWPSCRVFVDALSDARSVSERGFGNRFRPLDLVPRPAARHPRRLLTGALVLTILAALPLAVSLSRSLRVSALAPPDSRDGHTSPNGTVVRAIAEPYRDQVPKLAPRPPAVPASKRRDTTELAGRASFAKKAHLIEPRAQNQSVDVTSTFPRHLARSILGVLQAFSNGLTSQGTGPSEKPARTADQVDPFKAKSKMSQSSRPSPMPGGASQPEFRPAIDDHVRGASDRTGATKRVPKTVTIHVLLPTEKAELVVKGEVGRGNPDEWYGPTRVIHSPPMDKEAEYRVGAFWLDTGGQPLTRSCALRVEPGKVYEVDLRSSRPSFREIPKASTSGETSPGKSS